MLLAKLKEEHKDSFDGEIEAKILSVCLETLYRVSKNTAVQKIGLIVRKTPLLFSVFVMSVEIPKMNHCLKVNLDWVC